MFLGRGKNYLEVDYSTPDLFDHYLSGVTPIESLSGGKTRARYEVKSTLFTKILRDFNNMVMKNIIINNFEFEIPYKLGNLSIRKKLDKVYLNSNGEIALKYIKVDHHKTQELWASDADAKEKKLKVYHENEHSNGYSFRFYWRKYNAARAKNIIYKAFLPSREHKRFLAKSVKDKSLKLNFYEFPTKKRKLPYTPYKKK
jgi:hypothetical protein